MGWKLKVWGGTAFAGLAAISFVNGVNGAGVLSAFAFGLCMIYSVIYVIYSVLWLKAAWRTRNVRVVSYQEWVNLMLKENGQEPVNKRWNG